MPSHAAPLHNRVSTECVFVSLADCDAAVQCEGNAQLQAGAGPPSGATVDVCSSGEWHEQTACLEDCRSAHPRAHRQDIPLQCMCGSAVFCDRIGKGSTIVTMWDALAPTLCNVLVSLCRPVATHLPP